MKESLREYLKELSDRQDQDKLEKEKGKSTDSTEIPTGVGTAEPTGQIDSEKLRKGDIPHEGSNLSKESDDPNLK